MKEMPPWLKRIFWTALTSAESNSPAADDALYERHLTFDRVTPVGAATPRDKFEAIARSIRDVLSSSAGSGRSGRTTKEMSKRVYYCVARIPDRPLRWPTTSQT